VRSFAAVRFSKTAAVRNPTRAHTQGIFPYAVPLSNRTDFKYIKNNVDEVESNVRSRKATADVKKIVQLYDTVLHLLQRTESLRAGKCLKENDSCSVS
jgi:hypothetical protein